MDDLDKMKATPVKVWENAIYVAVIDALHAPWVGLILGGAESTFSADFARELLVKALRRTADVAEKNGLRLNKKAEAGVKRKMEEILKGIQGDR